MAAVVHVDQPDGLSLIHQSVAGKPEAPDPGISQSDPEQTSEQPNPNLGFPFTRWSPTLLEIKQIIARLVQGTSLERRARLGQVCVKWER